QPGPHVQLAQQILPPLDVGHHARGHHVGQRTSRDPCRRLEQSLRDLRRQSRGELQHRLTQLLLLDPVVVEVGKDGRAHLAVELVGSEVVEDARPHGALDDDVEPPALQLLVPGDDPGADHRAHARTPGVGALVSGLELGHRHHLVPGQRRLHQRSVARLEDVQGKHGVREQHGRGEGEDLERGCGALHPFQGRHGGQPNIRTPGCHTEPPLDPGLPDRVPVNSCMSIDTVPQLPSTPWGRARGWLARMYTRVESYANTPAAFTALIVVAAIDSAFFPVPPFVLLIPMIIAAPRKWFRLTLWGTLASIAGSLLGYAIGAAMRGALNLIHIDPNGRLDLGPDWLKKAELVLAGLAAAVAVLWLLQGWRQRSAARQRATGAAVLAVLLVLASRWTSWFEVHGTLAELLSRNWWTL